MTVLYSNDNVLKEITVCLLYIKSIMVSGVLNLSQPTITCSKLTIGTLEQGVKYVQS